MASNNTVILGAGIIGVSTAYYLSQSPRTQAQNIHLIEPLEDLFHCASGFAGGFLAADWFAPSVASLGDLSFKLHKELAESNDGRSKWGYCRSTGTSLSQTLENADEEAVGGSGEDWLRDGTSRAQAAREVPPGETSLPSWLTMAKGSSLETISAEGTTAQVDPMRLCEFLLSQALERGIQLHKPAKAISVAKDMNDKLASIRICTADGVETDLPCTRLIITAGAWSPQVFSTLFPSSPSDILPISHLAGHSLLLRSPCWNETHDSSGCHAVFATDTLGFSPEIFSRINTTAPNNHELYIAGLNSTSLPLPATASGATIDEHSIQQLKDVSARMLGRGQDEKVGLEVLRASLCFRPVTASGRPIIGRVPDAKLGKGWATYEGAEGGVFVAAGHGAWGIAQSLGTGKVMSELLEGLETSANVKALGLV